MPSMLFVDATWRINRQLDNQYLIGQASSKSQIMMSI